MPALYDLFLASAEKVLVARTALWQEERKKLEKLIAECNATHTSPPDNYWHAEANARGVMHNAQFFLDVVKDTFYEYREQRKRREQG